MRQAEDKQKGIMAIECQGHIFKFARTKYDGRLGCFTPDSVVNIKNYTTFFNKKEAQIYAKHNGFPLSHIARFGNRFGKLWGIRYDFRDEYFLAEFD